MVKRFKAKDWEIGSATNGWEHREGNESEKQNKWPECVAAVSSKERKEGI